MSSIQEAVKLLPPSTLFVNRRNGITTSYRMNSPQSKDLNTETSKLPLVFLHGFNGSSKSWACQFANFTDHVVIAIDAPGFGGSHLVEGGMVAIGNEIADLITSLDLGPVILIGHSMGGMQAQIMAATRPDLCAGLVLSCTHKGYANTSGTPLGDEIMQRIQHRETLDNARYGALRIRKMLAGDIAPDVFNFLAEVAGEIKVDGIISGGTAMHYLDTTDLLANISAPTIIFTSEMDIVVSSTASSALGAGLPKARQIQLAGVGHAPYCEDAPQFNLVLSNFLESI
jgi:3-oxoadipate enol-lactonase